MSRTTETVDERLDAIRSARWGYPSFTGAFRGFDAAGLRVDARERGDWSVLTSEGRLVAYGTAASLRTAMRQARAAAVAAVEGGRA